MSKKFIPLAAMEKLIKKTDSEVRVSEKAKEALKNELESLGIEISQRAWKFAVHAGRKTIKSEDIKLATGEMRR